LVGRVSADITIAHGGKFIDSCTLPGEGKDAWLHPSHPYCAQVSYDRFLCVYQTRGFSGIDSEHSIVYQLRADQPDGPVLKEGFFSEYREDWNAHGDGKLYIKSHGHPKVIGVPRGAVDGQGTLYPAENIFLATWYVIPAVRDPQTGVVKRVGANQLESIHFRLNTDGSDIELLDESAPLFREKGYETDRKVCSIDPPQTSVNQWLRPPTALNPEKTRWADAFHFPSGVAAVEIAIDVDSRRYQWLRTGPLAVERVRGKLMEGSLNRLAPDDWVLAARARGHHWGKGVYGYCIAWFRTNDPFAGWGDPTYTAIPSSYCPKPVHLCEDGVLRVFSGHLGGRNTKRNPLFCWDIDPDDGFAATNRRTILDLRDSIRFPMVGFAKLSPVKNNRQILTMRVSSMSQRQPTEKYPALTEDELGACGAYYSVITYDPPVPDTWQFQN
jgi:hypothetical protein